MDPKENLTTMTPNDQIDSVLQLLHERKLLRIREDIERQLLSIRLAVCLLEDRIVMQKDVVESHNILSYCRLLKEKLQHLLRRVDYMAGSFGGYWITDEIQDDEDFNEKQIELI